MPSGGKKTDRAAGALNALTQALLATGASAREILDEALLPGVEIDALLGK